MAQSHRIQYKIIVPYLLSFDDHQLAYSVSHKIHVMQLYTEMFARITVVTAWI